MPELNQASKQLSPQLDVANQKLSMRQESEYEQAQLNTAKNISQNPFAIFLLTEGQTISDQRDMYKSFAIASTKQQDSAGLQEKFTQLNQDCQNKVIKCFEHYIQQILDYGKLSTNSISRLEWYLEHYLFFYQKLLKNLQNKTKAKQRESQQTDKKKKSSCQKFCYHFKVCILFLIRFIVIFIMQLLADIEGRDCMNFILALRLAWIEGYTQQIQKTIDQQLAFIIAIVYIISFVITCIIKLCKWTQKVKEKEQYLLKLLTPSDN